MLTDVARGSFRSEPVYTLSAIPINAISDAVIGTDMQGVFDYLNVAVDKMTGWRLADSRGQSLEMVMSLINSDTGAPVIHRVKLVLREREPMGILAGTVLVCRDVSQVAI